MTQRERAAGDSSHDAVTVIGLGLMGQALAAALRSAGHPTTVWNRSAAKAEQLVKRGAILTGSARQAVTASPLVIICVSDYDAVHELLDPLEDVLAGRTVVNLTSGTAKQARETAEWAAERAITYLDGVILAVPPAIATPDAMLLYSGSRAAFDTHEPTLQRFGTTTHVGDDHGLSSQYDMAILSLMWNVLNGFLHGTAILATAKVDAVTAAPIMNQLVVAMTGWITAYAEQIDAARYPADDSTIDTHVAAMEHLLHESESLGVNTELPRLVKALADRAVAEGRGGDSYAAMIEQFQRP